MCTNGQERLISKNINDYAFNRETGLLSYSVNNGVLEEKIKLSAAHSVSGIREIYQSTLNSKESENYIMQLSIDAQPILVDSEYTLTAFSLNENELLVRDENDAFILTLSGNNISVSDALEIDDEESLLQNKKGTFAIYNYDDEELKLLDGTIIAEDIKDPLNYSIYELNNNNFVYLEDGEVLKIYDGKQMTEVYDDVAMYQVYGNYLGYYTGDDELYLWDGKEPVLLTDDEIYDVQWIYSVAEERGIDEHPLSGKFNAISHISNSEKLLGIKLAEPAVLSYAKESLSEDEFSQDEEEDDLPRDEAPAADAPADEPADEIELTAGIVLMEETQNDDEIWEMLDCFEYSFEDYIVYFAEDAEQMMLAVEDMIAMGSDVVIIDGSFDVSVINVAVKLCEEEGGVPAVINAPSYMYENTVGAGTDPTDKAEELVEAIENYILYGDGSTPIAVLR